MKRKIGTVLYHTLIILFAVLMLYPLLWMISASFKDTLEIFQGTDFSRSLFGWIIISRDGRDCQDVTFTRFYINSFIIVIAAMVGNLTSCLMAANAFAKIRFPLKGLWFALMDGDINAAHACKADSAVHHV